MMGILDGKKHTIQISDGLFGERYSQIHRTTSVFCENRWFIHYEFEHKSQRRNA